MWEKGEVGQNSLEKAPLYMVVERAPMIFPYKVGLLLGPQRHHFGSRIRCQLAFGSM